MFSLPSARGWRRVGILVAVGLVCAWLFWTCWEHTQISRRMRTHMELHLFQSYLVRQR